MKSWILISSVVGSLALVTHESPAQPAAGVARHRVASPPTSGSPPASTTAGPVVVPRSMVHRFQSKIVDDVYEVRVSVPEDYENDEGLRPVIYALDGQWNFALLHDIVGKLAYDGSIPDPIVVGITWAEAGFQPAAERSRDLLPVMDPNLPGSGGAAQFLKVLEAEVFPLVEANYRASTERVITGGSAGGLFVSYALLERPDLFTAYVASSGATGGTQAEYFTRRLAEISPDLLRKERAYFTVGALYDNEETVRGFVGALEAVVGKSSRIVLDVVDGVGHTGNEPFAYTRGLLHAFQRARLPLSERFLERYEGDYFEPASPELPDLTIEAGRGELYIVQEGERWPFVFYAATPKDFYADGVDIDLTFYRNDEGKLTFTLNYQRSLYEQVRR
jgi:predicted alpha/beta superfamily hydrolase